MVYIRGGADGTPAIEAFAALKVHKNRSVRIKRCALLAKQEAYKGRLDSLVKTGAMKTGKMPPRSGKNYYQITEPWKNANYLDTKGRDMLYVMVSKKIATDKKTK